VVLVILVFVCVVVSCASLIAFLIRSADRRARRQALENERASNAAKIAACLRGRK
jgi:hypothetical protein